MTRSNSNDKVTGINKCGWCTRAPQACKEKQKPKYIASVAGTMTNIKNIAAPAWPRGYDKVLGPALHLCEM